MSQDTDGLIEAQYATHKGNAATVSQDTDGLIEAQYATHKGNAATVAHVGGETATTSPSPLSPSEAWKPSSP